MASSTKTAAEPSPATRVNPDVAIGIIDRRLAVTDHPRARDWLLDMRARWMVTRDMANSADHPRKGADRA